MISNDKAKEILDNAPEGATHYQEYGDGFVVYYKMVGSSWHYINNTGSHLSKHGNSYLANVLIKLSDLLAQLEQEVEWKNGDECYHLGESHIIIGKHPRLAGMVICENKPCGSVKTIDLLCLETAEQHRAKQNIEWQGVFHEMSLVEVADILLANGITADNYRKEQTND